MGRGDPSQRHSADSNTAHQPVAPQPGGAGLLLRQGFIAVLRLLAKYFLPSYSKQLVELGILLGINYATH